MIDMAETRSSEHLFAAALLFANLCDVQLPTAVRCGYLAEDFWRRQNFFQSLAPALAASVRGEVWPPQSPSADCDTLFNLFFST